MAIHNTAILRRFPPTVASFHAPRNKLYVSLCDAQCCLDIIFTCINGGCICCMHTYGSFIRSVYTFYYIYSSIQAYDNTWRERHTRRRYRSSVIVTPLIFCPGKHDIFSQCMFKVGHGGPTLNQHWCNVSC